VVEAANCVSWLQVLDLLYPESKDRAHFGPAPMERKKRFASAIYRFGHKATVHDVASKFAESEGAVVNNTRELVNILNERMKDFIRFVFVVARARFTQVAFV
jgi:hypothetical protein